MQGYRDLLEHMGSGEERTAEEKPKSVLARLRELREEHTEEAQGNA